MCVLVDHCLNLLRVTYVDLTALALSWIALKGGVSMSL
jgi:hypothetical protein